MKKIIQSFLDVDKIVCPNCKKKNLFLKSGTISRLLNKCINCDYEIERKQYFNLLPPYNTLRKLLGICLFLFIVFSIIIIFESNKSEKLDKLINNGIIIDNIPIIDKQYKKGKYSDGSLAHNVYKYNFQIFNDDIKGDFKILFVQYEIDTSSQNIPQFEIGDKLTILYLEENPKVHTIVKINDYFTILPKDTVSYIYPYESSAFRPQLKSIERFNHINW